jgi:tetratricopeptide (TPR) repeat protein
LALEFAASRHDPLLLRAEITSSLTPLAPVADALRSSLNDPARVARLNALPLAWRVEVARLVPEFGSSADAVVIPTHEGRSRLLEGLTHGLLAALGPHGMLVLDDLHRFDADSAALALGVLRRSPRAALATARAPELEANTEVCAVLEGFERHARLEKLALGALSPLEVTALIRDSGRDAEALHRFTGGNPLYVLEALRHPDADRATQGVLELVRRRVQRLGEPVQRLLEAASLSGEAFHLDGVQRASRLEEPEALEALERAVDAELILESPPGHRFSHALIRQALEDGLSAERKRRLHRHLAMDASESARIAEHLERGGRPLQAVPHRLRAAVEATRLHAYRLALAHQDAALEDGLDDVGFAGLFEARYRLFVALADWDGLERELQRFEDTAARLAQPDLIAFVEMGWTDFCFRVGRYAQGVERATRLLRQPLPPEVEAMTRYTRGLSNLSLGYHEAAQRDCADALECAPDTWAMRGWALNTLAICQSTRGLFDAALEVNAESEAWFRAVADRHGIASTQRVAAPILARQGQEARALNLLEAALRTARDLHHVFLERAVLETIVKVHLGRLEDAANAGVNEHEDAFLEGVSLEKLERALPWMERCLELARDPRDAFLEPLWQARVARARWLLSSNDPIPSFRIAYLERPSPSDG